MSATWFGIRDNGDRVQIGHEELMRWALDNDLQFQVGWSHAVRVRDTRLARSPEAAREQGWDDLADALEAHFRMLPARQRGEVGS